MKTPLAELLRPKKLVDFYGQKHILAADMPLTKSLANKCLHSMILYGPTGTGKTTLAQIMADIIDANFIQLSAINAGVKELREVIAIAQDYRKIKQQLVLFVDEVHSFNKSQQDVLLPHIENGVIIFIAATTQNPAFAINSALISRVKIYTLVKLKEQELDLILTRAMTFVATKITIKSSVKKQLIAAANGDGRLLLNYLDILIDSGIKDINSKNLANIVQNPVANFDNKADIFYQQLSAFHKSVRGSNPDAAVYWFARMISGGADAQVIARRLLAIASEDIGNADPKALEITLNAWDIYHRVGTKEGHRAIAQAAIYCAIAAKSNAVYLAFNAAMADAQKDGNLAVPKHLCNAIDSGAKDLGFGVGYRYAHNETNAYANGQTYFPDGIKNRQYYQPTDRGLEAKIAQRMAQYKQWDKETK